MWPFLSQIIKTINRSAIFADALQVLNGIVFQSILPKTTGFFVGIHDAQFLLTMMVFK
ncbi:hypothetical protein FHS77_000561 [Paenochrobactrum gallinarii]|uniref:Uncharacterized protein n=1 Tax=Paenochrobactrum gallinarii TaxID=643673 RepID=A0A841LU61_9HYPH|nr:hypothetical protein [Paenochrobactrum gallinarii]